MHCESSPYLSFPKFQVNLVRNRKKRLENNRSLIKEQEAELTTQRQQLVKLSELVDKKAKETEKYVKDLG